MVNQDRKVPKGPKGNMVLPAPPAPWEHLDSPELLALTGPLVLVAPKVPLVPKGTMEPEDSMEPPAPSVSRVFPALQVRRERRGTAAPWVPPDPPDPEDQPDLQELMDHRDPQGGSATWGHQERRVSLESREHQEFRANRGSRAHVGIGVRRVRLELLVLRDPRGAKDPQETTALKETPALWGFLVIPDHLGKWGQGAKMAPRGRVERMENLESRVLQALQGRTAPQGPWGRGDLRDPPAPKDDRERREPRVKSALWGRRVKPAL